MKKGILGRIFIFGFLLLAASFSHAGDREMLEQIEERLSGDLSIPDLLVYAYESNPRITSSKESWKGFIENFRIGKSYPDPQLAITYFPSPIETRLGPQDWNLTLSQAIPFPGRLAQKGKVLEADAAIAKLRLDKSVKTLVRDVTVAFHELAYIQAALEIARANLGVNRQMMEISQNAYARDKALFYDVSKARAQAAQVEYDLLLLQELEQTQKTRINTLLNRTPEAALGRARSLPPREIVFSLDEIYGLALVHQEDILIADETLNRSREAVRLAELSTLPTFKLGLFYAGIGSPDVAAPPSNAGDDAVGVQFGLNLPLWQGKNKSLKLKAQAEKEKARADKTDVVNTLKDRISRLWFRLRNSGRLISLYRDELIPQVRAQVETAQTWMDQGEGRMADFLEIQSTAYNFELSLERARADYGQALVKLEQAAGVILDRKKSRAPRGSEDLLPKEAGNGGSLP